MGLDGDVVFKVWYRLIVHVHPVTARRFRHVLFNAQKRIQSSIYLNWAVLRRRDLQVKKVKALNALAKEGIEQQFGYQMLPVQQLW